MTTSKSANLNAKMREKLLQLILVILFRKPSALELSWFVNTNEDVADFRLELASHKYVIYSCFLS